MTPTVRKIINYIATIAATVSLPSIAFAGHELIKITGPGNIGGNSIRYAMMLMLMAPCSIVLWISLLWMPPSVRRIFLIMQLVNMAYIIGSFLYSIDYYWDEEAFMFKHHFLDERPPALSNYIIVASVNLLLMLPALLRRKTSDD